MKIDVDVCRTYVRELAVQQHAGALVIKDIGHAISLPCAGGAKVILLKKQTDDLEISLMIKKEKTDDLENNGNIK